MSDYSPDNHPCPVCGGPCDCADTICSHCDEREDDYIVYGPDVRLAHFRMVDDATATNRATELLRPRQGVHAMKVTEKQFIVLMDTLRASLSFAETSTAREIFTYRVDVRQQVYNDILMTASDEPIEISNVTL